MLTLQKFLAVVAAAVIFSFLAVKVHAGEWMVSIDISSSTLITSDKQYALRAGQYVSERLKDRGFDMGDEIRVRSLGEFGDKDAIKFDLRATKKYRSEKVLADIEFLVSSVPALIEKNAGAFRVHGQTNILAHLRTEAYTLNCSSGGGVILISDALESSDYISATELASGQKGLPTPRGEFLEGCDLILVGIGQLAENPSGKITERLIQAWGDWSAKAGVQHFEPVPSF